MITYFRGSYFATGEIASAHGKSSNELDFCSLTRNFWNELKKRGKNPEDYTAGNEDILYPKWSKEHYKGGIKEYERLERAIAIDEEAAISSASWGLFHIMGFNYATCKCDSVQQFVALMKENEGKQLDLFTAFIQSNRLDTYLRNKDWAGFAKRYNGPAYA